MRRVYKNLSSVLVTSLIFLVMIGSIVTKDKEVSNFENRRLQVMPTVDKIVDEGFNINAYIYEVLTGDLFKKWNSYFSDHIIYRNNIVSIHTDIQETLNKKFINGAYIGEDNYIFSDNNIKISEEELKERAEYFNLLAEELDVDKTYLINLPYKSEVYEENMPIINYQGTSSEYFEILESYIDKELITTMNMYSDFKGVDDLYYKTDHHWNMNGSFLAYQNIIEEIAKTYPKVGDSNSKDYYNIETYENYFIGVDGKKVGNLVEDIDDIEIYRDKNEEKYNITIRENKGEFFYEERLNKDTSNNDYTVYLNGENPNVVIENSESENDLEVFILGDSMDNSLVSLLAAHFSKIHNYDLRSYKGDIKEKIKEINPDIFIIIGLSNSILDKDVSDIFNIEI